MIPKSAQNFSLLNTEVDYPMWGFIIHIPITRSQSVKLFEILKDVTYISSNGSFHFNLRTYSRDWVINLAYIRSNLQRYSMPEYR